MPPILRTPLPTATPTPAPTPVAVNPFPALSAKNWPGLLCVGDGVTNDGPAIQAYEDFCRENGIESYYPPSVYLTRQTILLQDPLQVKVPAPGLPYRQMFGWVMRGETCANKFALPGVPGVAFVLDNPSCSALFRVGQMVGRDMLMQNIALCTTGNGAGRVGLDIPNTLWSRFRLEGVSNLGFDYAVHLRIGPGTLGSNGEQLVHNNCVMGGNIAMYRNDAAQALTHSFSDCNLGVGPGGILFKMGDYTGATPGIDFDAFRTLSTAPKTGGACTVFRGHGAERARVTGGRFENFDTIVSYTGGSPLAQGIVLIDNCNFASVPNRGPFIDATRSVDASGNDGATGSQLYLNHVQQIVHIRDCIFTGHDLTNTGQVYPLTVATRSDDNSKWIIENCRFNGFSDYSSLTNCPNATFINSYYADQASGSDFGYLHPLVSTH